MPLKIRNKTGSDDRPASPADVPAVRQGANHCIRTLLMMRLREMKRANGLTQVEAARCFGVSQPRISHLAQNRIERFTVDALINMLDHAVICLHVTFVLVSPTPADHATDGVLSLGSDPSHCESGDLAASSPVSAES